MSIIIINNFHVELFTFSICLITFLTARNNDNFGGPENYLTGCFFIQLLILMIEEHVSS